MKKLKVIFLNFVPVLVMIGLIPLISNDYLLCTAYVAIILISLAIKYEKKEIYIFILGAVMLTVSEYFFISTGVETFLRHSLFGSMPLWLPILWGYAFIAIKRGVLVFEQ